MCHLCTDVCVIWSEVTVPAPSQGLACSLWRPVDTAQLQEQVSLHPLPPARGALLVSGCNMQTGAEVTLMSLSQCHNFLKRLSPVVNQSSFCDMAVGAWNYSSKPQAACRLGVCD